MNSYKNLSDESDDSDDDYIKRRRREKYASDEEEKPMRDHNNTRRESPNRQPRQQQKHHQQPPNSPSSNYQKRKRGDDDHVDSPSNESSQKKKKTDDDWDYESDPRQKIIHQIISICEFKPSDELYEKLKEVSTRITTDLEDDYQTNITTISDILMQCVADFPVKSSLYAIVIALINNKLPKFGELLVSLTVEHVIQSHNNNDWIRVKSLLRFICELMHFKVVAESDIYQIFDTFIDLSVKNAETLIGMNYMYVILGALPWGIEAFKENSIYLSDISSKLTKYFEVYNQNDFGLYQVYKGQKDCLGAMWDQFKYFLSNQTETKVIKSLLRAHINVTESDLSDGRAHKLEIPAGSLNDVATKDTDFSKGYLFKSRLGLYESMIPNSLHLLSPIDRLVVEEYISDFLYFFNGSHRDCVNRLYIWAGDLATLAFKKDTSVSSPKSMEEKELAILNDLDPSGEYFQHMAMDIILGAMCCLPAPPVKIHFYNVVVIGLCLQKCTKDNFSREIVKKYINYVFENIDDFDDECCMQRFTSLMSYYLSQFDCKWSWDKWSFIFNDPDSSTNKRREQFIRLVLQKTLHVTYMNKVKRSIKGSSNLTEDKFDDDSRYNEDEDLTDVPFAKFLPYSPDATFKYTPDSPYHADATKLLDAIKGKKKDNTEVIELFSTLDCKDDKILLLDIFISCILSNQKNLTEFSDLLTYYKEAISQLMDFDVLPQRVNIIRCLWRYWHKSPQRIILLMKKLLLQHDIISCQSLANYLFTDNELLFSYGYSWDILKSCLDTQITRALRAFEYGDDSTSTSDTVPKIKKDNQPSDHFDLDKAVKGLDSMFFKMLLGEIRETVYIITRLLTEKLLTYDNVKSWEFNHLYGLLKEVARLYQVYVKDLQGYVESILSESSNTIVKEHLLSLFKGLNFFKHTSVFVPAGSKATTPRYERRFDPILQTKNYTILDTRHSIHDLLIQEIQRVENEIPVIITKDHPLCSLLLPPLSDTKKPETVDEEMKNNQTTSGEQQ
ncbi:cap binding protein with MIF4G domain [Naegleria gruberi]|uniref:Cap binding protein with MIF4G domain n=1 Tax=Naegleria gruberi TaxID=5762 RepID=D2VH37_NAEGR|nr:cap binding protein with MIF4G domain [Naegleria gruberi]EFC43823.1 cap binding protein with MIF4G domain [Naegleria gruberi]|eukprot:XP_002676567.1 cap binding protein with MIF4G domain [Naegleria gruberi strain NEG-M]